MRVCRFPRFARHASVTCCACAAPNGCTRTSSRPCVTWAQANQEAIRCARVSCARARVCVCRHLRRPRTRMPPLKFAVRQRTQTNAANKRVANARANRRRRTSSTTATTTQQQAHNGPEARALPRCACATNAPAAHANAQSVRTKSISTRVRRSLASVARRVRAHEPQFGRRRLLMLMLPLVVVVFVIRARARAPESGDDDSKSVRLCPPVSQHETTSDLPVARIAHTHCKP